MGELFLLCKSRLLLKNLGMRLTCLLFVFSFIFILLNSGHAFDVEINGQMYRLSSVPQYMGPDGDSNYYSEWHVIAAQPWYGNESLAASLSSQVGNSLIVEGKVPVFVFSRNGPYFRYAYPTGISHISGELFIYYFVVASLLIDTDGDGQYDRDDLDDDNDGLTDAEELYYGTDSLLADSDGNGFNDIQDVFQVIKAQKVELEALVTTLNAELDARPTQASYDAMVAERDDLAEQFNTLDSRVFALLPKEQNTSNTLTLLDSGSLGSDRDYSTVSDQGFDFNALEGQLRWYSDGVEILDNSVIRITKNGNERFNFDSIEFAQWESEDHFSTHVNADNEMEAILLAAAQYDSRPPSYFKIIDDSGMEVYAHTTSGNTSLDNFHAHQVSDQEWSVSLMGGGDVGNAYTTISTTLAKDVQYVDIRSEGYKVHVDGFKVSYSLPPVATKTLEEHVSDLVYSLNAMESERDARPTQADYASVVAERDAKLSMEEVRDMKLKSRMMQVDGGSASLNITLEATDNLGITSPTWSPVPENKVVIHPNFQNGKIRIDVDGDDNTNSGTKFYRFKMDD